jgi:hypothetical protein
MTLHLETAIRRLIVETVMFNNAILETKAERIHTGDSYRYDLQITPSYDREFPASYSDLRGVSQTENLFLDTNNHDNLLSDDIDHPRQTPAERLASIRKSKSPRSKDACIL